MTPEIAPETRRLFLDGRAVACGTAPYMAGAILAMSYTLSHSVTSQTGAPTMAVTEKGQLLVHPDFVEELRKEGGAEAVGFVVLHEVEHILFGHAKKHRRLLEKYGDKFDPVCFGLAVDYSINPGLLAISTNRGPSWWIRPPTGPCAGVFPSDAGLPNGLRAEDYYDLLTSGQTKKKPQGGSKPGQGCVPSMGGDGLSDEAQGLAAQLPEWSDAKMASVKAQTLALAKKQEERKRGTVPGGFLLELEAEVAPPKVNWRDELTSQALHCIEHSPGTSHGTYSVISRRQSAVGYGLGAPRLAGLIEYRPKVVVIGDTSGSMCNDLAKIPQEIMGIVSALDAEVTFISCDAAVGAVTTVHSVADVTAAIRGGGGTYMYPAFMEAKKLHPDVVVCITDGAIEGQPREGYGFDVIWCLVTKYDGTVAPTVEAGWGRIIYVED